MSILNYHSPSLALSPCHSLRESHRVIAILLLTLFSFPLWSFAQEKQDSLIRNDFVITPMKIDTLKQVKRKTPRGAAIRSAVLPGWGQAYNKKYWKIPIVYAALGTTGGIFSYNLKQYRKIRYAYTVLVNQDSANFPNVAPELQPFIEANAISSLRLNRDVFRRNIDYTVLFFILFWGLNVVDATVDAHLKGFNVSNDLSLKIKPCLNYNSLGLSLVFDIHKGAPNSKFKN